MSTIKNSHFSQNIMRVKKDDILGELRSMGEIINTCRIL
jgi:hypothetical protein